MNKFYIRKDSLQPHYQAIAENADGSPIDISSAAILFKMKDALLGTLVTSAMAEVDSGPGGLMRYPWGATDVSTPGIFKATFEVWSLAGGKFEIPRMPDEEAFVIVLT